MGANRKTEDYQTLCRAYSKSDNKGRDDYEPVIIYRHINKGRSFYTILGHDVVAMRNPGFQTLLLRGTEWAASGRVTIAISKALSANIGRTE